jgi:COMPASS component BRE2
LPGSYIRVYRNGRYIGTPFEDLYAFLPPASKPLPALGGRELDDGTLGYYPAASCFKGGAVEMNFGPDWWDRPEEIGEGVRGMWERYEEQIAEDVVWDLVDEVDLGFVQIGAGKKVEVSGAPQEEGGGIKEMVMEDE